jgi:diguanylate cyclase (GGDEF)-like protein
MRKDGSTVHIMWSARWSEADQVRIAVARDVSQLKRVESMQAALYGISEAAHSTEDLLALFKRIHEIVGSLLPATNFFVALHDSDTDQLSFPYFVDEYDPPPEPRRLDTGTLSAHVIRSGQALLLTPDSQDPLPEHVGPIVGRSSLDWLGVPLRTHQGVIGALVVQSYSGDVRYSEHDKELLQYVSIQVAMAIERKRSHARLQYVARFDPLTDLPNRELFQDRLQSALSLARREKNRLALLYIDLDLFKPVNDTCGHVTGDLLLREVAERIRRSVRESDTVARIGGDEFIVLLNNVGAPDGAMVVAETVRAVLDRPFQITGDTMRISASIGISIFPTHGQDGKQLLRHADTAMYRAKKAGGNGLVMFEPLTDGVAREAAMPTPDLT